jgi:CBS domain-containing protein
MLLDKNYLKKITLSLDALILTAINNLNSSGLKIVLVIDKNEKFIGIVNDGDIRRAFSGGYKINHPILYNLL